MMDMNRIVAAIKQFLTKLRPVTIRDRLLLAFLLMVLVPTVASGAISVVVGLKHGREQVIDKLNSVAVLEIGEVSLVLSEAVLLAAFGKSFTQIWSHWRRLTR